jgi:hypothetical protein
VQIPLRCAVHREDGAIAARHEPFGMQVSPPVATITSDVTIQTFIECDDRNRRLECIIESAKYYVRSTWELDGKRAQPFNELTLRYLPAGKYEVRLTLFGVSGMRGHVVRNIEV